MARHKERWLARIKDFASIGYSKHRVAIHITLVGKDREVDLEIFDPKEARSIANTLNLWAECKETDTWPGFRS